LSSLPFFKLKFKLNVFVVVVAVYFLSYLRPRQSIMASSKKNDDDSDYHDDSDDSDDSDAVPSSSKKTAEELFALAANATLPARKRIQPNIYGSTPSPSRPPPPSKKKATAPLVTSTRTNQSNNNSKKKRGRAATKKKTPSAPISTTVTTNVPPVNPSLTMNGTFHVSLSVSVFVCVEHTDHSF
jgi:cytoskeletal protein RodZ